MTSDDTYKTIVSKSEGSFRDRGSKFVAEAFPVTNQQEVKKLLAEAKKLHPKANHHCYAVRLTPDKSVFKLSDDREPSGSAGKPILNAILSNDLTDVLIIVSRYFGGSLLGVPGLINAYRSAAKNAIDHAEIIIKTVDEMYEIQFDYTQINEIINILKSENTVIFKQNFSELCSIAFRVRKKKSGELLKRINQNHRLVNNCKIVRLD